MTVIDPPRCTCGRELWALVLRAPEKVTPARIATMYIWERINEPGNACPTCQTTAKAILAREQLGW